MTEANYAEVNRCCCSGRASEDRKLVLPRHRWHPSRRGDRGRDGLPAGDRRQRDIVVNGVIGEKCGQLGRPDIVGPRRAESAHQLDRALHLAPPAVHLVGTPPATHQCRPHKP
jgi:hypothetical protein